MRVPYRQCPPLFGNPCEARGDPGDELFVNFIKFINANLRFAEDNLNLLTAFA